MHFHASRPWKFRMAAHLKVGWIHFKTSVRSISKNVCGDRWVFAGSVSQAKLFQANRHPWKFYSVVYGVGVSQSSCFKSIHLTYICNKNILVNCQCTIGLLPLSNEGFFHAKCPFRLQIYQAGTVCVWNYYLGYIHTNAGYQSAQFRKISHCIMEMDPLFHPNSFSFLCPLGCCPQIRPRPPPICVAQFNEGLQDVIR